MAGKEGRHTHTNLREEEEGSATTNTRCLLFPKGGGRDLKQGVHIKRDEKPVKQVLNDDLIEALHIQQHNVIDVM